MRRVRLHLKKAAEKLKAAEVLLENDCLEDAASRAYYAMFHAAKGYLYLYDEMPKTHRGIVSKMFELAKEKEELSEDELKELANALRIRIISDYDIEMGLDKDEVIDILKGATAFVKSINRIIDEKEMKR